METAWVPVEGDNYLYLYCLWVAGAYKGKGYGRALMEHCLADARDRGKSGICMLGAEKQKAWLSDQSFARKRQMCIRDRPRPFPACSTTTPCFTAVPSRR